MKYTFCPRRTDACGTLNIAYTPLLNINQTMTTANGMNATLGDVCWWEFSVNVEEFYRTHPIVNLTMVYINLVVSSRVNLNIFML